MRLEYAQLFGGHLQWSKFYSLCMNELERCDQ